MDVNIIARTTNADNLTLLAARNDYYDGNIVGKTLEEVMNGGSQEDLMRHLLMKGHYGPFEHSQVTLHFQISRGAMAQLTRHRFISFDIQSMRYVNFDEPDMYSPLEHWPITDDPIVRLKTRKGSIELNHGEVNEEIQASYDNSLMTYKKLLKMKVPAEDARNVLPIGTKVNVIASMNLRTILHIITLRSKGDAQSEIRELANHFKTVLEEVAPLTYKVWKENRLAIERAPLSP